MSLRILIRDVRQTPHRSHAEPKKFPVDLKNVIFHVGIRRYVFNVYLFFHTMLIEYK